MNPHPDLTALWIIAWLTLACSGASAMFCYLDSHRTGPAPSYAWSAFCFLLSLAVFGYIYYLS